MNRPQRGGGWRPARPDNRRGDEGMSCAGQRGQKRDLRRPARASDRGGGGSASVHHGVAAAAGPTPLPAPPAGSPPVAGDSPFVCAWWGEKGERPRESVGAGVERAENKKVVGRKEGAGEPGIFWGGRPRGLRVCLSSASPSLRLPQTPAFFLPTASFLFLASPPPVTLGCPRPLTPPLPTQRRPKSRRVDRVEKK